MVPVVGSLPSLPAGAGRSAVAVSANVIARLQITTNNDASAKNLGRNERNSPEAGNAEVVAAEAVSAEAVTAEAVPAERVSAADVEEEDVEAEAGKFGDDVDEEDFEETEERGTKFTQRAYEQLE